MIKSSASVLAGKQCIVMLIFSWRFFYAYTFSCFEFNFCSLTTCPAMDTYYCSDFLEAWTCLRESIFFLICIEVKDSEFEKWRDGWFFVYNINFILQVSSKAAAIPFLMPIFV